MPRRLKVVISAYACSPFRGSEHAVGWQFATQLAAHHDVTVLCGDVEYERPTQKEFDDYYRTNSLPTGLRVLYVEQSWLIRTCERLHRLPLMWWLYYVAYNLWQRKAFRQARSIMRREGVDVAHQLNMIGFREPGYLYRLGVPFVLGPIGGGNNEPRAYAEGCGGRAGGRAAVRTLLNEFQKRWSGRPKRAARAAAAILAATPEEHRMVTKLWGLQATLFPEAGATPKPAFVEKSPYDPKGRLRIMWSGMHCARKCLPILIDAVSCPELRERVVVTVLGEGEETGEWRRRAESNGVSEAFQWRGRVPHAEAVAIMAGNDVCAFTSTREGTPHVVVEALAAGVPVVCHDSCGMGVVVDAFCGLKVPLATYADSVKGFRDALVRLADSPDLIRTLSRGADARAREISWSVKAHLISEIYRSVAKPGESRQRA